MNPNYRASLAGRSLSMLRGAALVSCVAIAQPTLGGDECNQPERPPMPDGATATMEQMLEGQKGVKSFQSTNMAYMKCLEEQFSEAQSVAKKAKEADAKAAANATYEEAIEAYNAAVSAEEEVAGAFNIELREYKAANN